MTTNYPAPAPDYVGPAAKSSAGSNKPINRIVIHSTVSDCKPGGAREVAAYFRSKEAGGSAHYVVDPLEEVQVHYDSVIAWHAPPNPGSLGVEMCDRPHPTSKDRWAEGTRHALMLKRTALLVAQLCLAYDVPPRWVGVVGLRLGRKGVTTHAKVAKAFRQSDHWDPGAWPRRKFMREVRRQVAAIKAERKVQL